ncbi:MAG: hypothetical protein K1000chlam2_01749 [Chlamydiae bacterium]|nr:hypothetical protein [Chlamydiota bacterium]
MKALCKHPLSLLEVTIGLALTAILLTALFSSYRHLVQTNHRIKTVREEKHWEYVTHLRLNQIFENLQEGTLFTQDQTLHFFFNNGIDSHPEYCGDIEGTLSVEDKTFQLVLKDTRKEVFLKKAKNFSMQFFDTKKKELVSEWNEEYLPPIIFLHISGKTFTFLIPNASKEINYT